MEDLMAGLREFLELDQPHPPTWATATRRRLLTSIKRGDCLSDDPWIEPEPRTRSVSEPHRPQLALVGVDPRAAHAVAGGHLRRRQAGVSGFRDWPCAVGACATSLKELHDAAGDGVD
jgi:hypothetical protein